MSIVTINNIFKIVGRFVVLHGTSSVSIVVVIVVEVVSSSPWGRATRVLVYGTSML